MAKKQYFYSPYTGEIIKENKKMDWYGATDIVPPEISNGESLIFKDGVWVVEKNDNSEQLEKDRTNAINQKAKAIIYSKYPLEKQSSAQLGIYGDEYLATMKAFIKQVIDISNKAIDDGISADEVDWEGLDK